MVPARLHPFRITTRSTRGLTLRSALILASVAGNRGTGPSVASPPAPASSSGASAPTAAEADAFVRDVNTELRRLQADADHASWVKSTYIMPDSEYLETQ